MKKFGKKIVSVALCAALTLPMMFSFAGCGNENTEIPKKGSIDLTNGIVASAAESFIEESVKKERNKFVRDFYVNVFKNTVSGTENSLVAPVSVLYALSMTANGAAGETLEEFESTFGLSVEDLNVLLKDYAKNLPQGNKYKLSIANSIWMKNDENFTVEIDFIQKNMDYYAASVYSADFDEKTCKDINKWVSLNTDGMIEKIIDEINEDTVMFLINALAFDAEWANVYDETSIWDDVFTTADGTEQKTEFMHSNEYRYLADENTTGVMKYYSGNKYAFVAFLPEEGISVDGYISGLTGEKLSSLLENACSEKVITAIPKFSAECTYEMNDILGKMGIKKAFSGDEADFSKIGSYKDANLYISKVLHKTYIDVDERGTKAGAVTAVMMNETTAFRPEEPKRVVLDRPFVYMIIDCDNNMPLFMGTCVSVK